MEIENDDYLVDYVEPTGTNPGYTGTYQSHYGVGGAGEGSPPFVWPYDRESALSRDSYVANFDVRYIIMPRFSVRGTYKWERVDREYFLVGEEETETEKNTYTLGLNAPLGPVRARVRYTYQDIDNPFANSTANEQGGACEALGSQVITGSWIGGRQYYEFWSTRQADMTNLPEQKHEVTANLTYPIKHNVSLSAGYRWKDEDTVSGAGELNMPSASFWYAPHPKLGFTLTYAYDDETRTSRICLPVYNG
jgi:predicted porin